MASMFLARCAEAGGELCGLTPARNRGFWVNVLEDIVSSPAVEAAVQKHLNECGDRGEYKVLSIDATVQCLLKVVGMATYRHSAASRSTFPVPEDEAVYKMMTVRGRTGAVVAIQGIKSEAGQHVAELLSRCLSPQHLSQTLHVASDSPGRELFRSLQSILPNLQSMSLDATHICMVYEQCLGNQKTQGSKWLRLIMAKFAVIDKTSPAATWGPFFTGEGTSSFSQEESIVKEMMVADSLARDRGFNILQRLKADEPWYTVVQFLEAVAAVCAVFPEDMSRTNGQGTPLRKLLQNLCQPAKVQWLLNDTRFRHEQLVC